MGPPAEVIEAGNFEHSCEGEMVVKLTLDKVKKEEKRGAEKWERELGVVSTDGKEFFFLLSFSFSAALMLSFRVLRERAQKRVSIVALEARKRAIDGG